MVVKGPLHISSESSEGGSGFTLRLEFTEEFQALDDAARGQTFTEYLKELQRQSTGLEETDPNRQGMLIVLQVGEQLLPLIQTNSLPLNETLEIEISQQLPLGEFLASQNPLN